MNRLDQQEPTEHNGDPMNLDQIKKMTVLGFTKFTSWLSAGKDRLTVQFKRVIDPEMKAVQKQRQAIKPVRVVPSEPSNRDRSTVPSDITNSLPVPVQRIEDSAHVTSNVKSPKIDEAPDRTFEISHQSDRPELYHVTPGTPSLIEDTAVHEAVDESAILPADETMVIPVVRHSQTDSFQLPQLEQVALASSANDIYQSPSVKLSSGSAHNQLPPPSIPVKQNSLSRYLPGIRSFFAYYQKRHKADRAIRRNTRERVYRLKGYTTVAKINRKRQSEKKQRLLRRALIGIIAILTIVILFQIYNPFKDLSEWYRILGISSLDELTQTTTTASSGGQTVITAPTTFNTIIATTSTTPPR